MLAIYGPRVRHCHEGFSVKEISSPSDGRELYILLHAGCHVVLFVEVLDVK